MFNVMYLDYPSNQNKKSNYKDNPIDFTNMYASTSSHLQGSISTDCPRTNASPLSGCRNPNYNTFSSNSRPNTVNNLSDYEPGKIISTHFYKQPTIHHLNSKNDTTNDHAANSASRLPSRQDVRPNQTTHIIQPSTYNAHNQFNNPSSGIPLTNNNLPTIPRTQNVHVSSHSTDLESCLCCFAFLVSLV